MSGQTPRGKGAKHVDLLRNRKVVTRLEPEQLSLLETLSILSYHMRAALKYPKPKAYLAYHRIPFALAQSFEMGYLPPITSTNKHEYEKDKMLSFWADSLVTPTITPHGEIGYVARKLSLWEEGIDEETHKTLLARNNIPRIIKTGNPGWIWQPADIGSSVIVVEGKFEVFSLVAAGLNDSDVIGVLTNSANVDWLPKQVRTVLVAFNGDERGRIGAKRLITTLQYAGIHAIDCPPPQDEYGTDCSSRWRIQGEIGLAYLFTAWNVVQHD